MFRIGSLTGLRRMYTVIKPSLIQVFLLHQCMLSNAKIPHKQKYCYYNAMLSILSKNGYENVSCKDRLLRIM